MRRSLAFAIMAALIAACSTKEIDTQTPQPRSKVFYASFEQPTENGTRVYANEDLLLRWTADDRVSIFEKNTYNQQFRFTGETGDNAGGFKKVGGDDYYTGNSIPNVVSVYPYQEPTKITESETITVTLPAEQHYSENTFGLGANTMVSVSADNFLQYKNVGGYLVLKLYGDGVSVSSITLKGNKGEKLAGKATVTMPIDGTPTVSLANDATDEITLVCDSPVELGATIGESKDFWFVVPPVTFTQGFSITVAGAIGGEFEKNTLKVISIERSNVSKMSPIKVTMIQPNCAIFYTSSDGNIITPNAPDVFGASIVTNEYVDGRGIITFDGEITSIGKEAFYRCESLESIVLPESVTSIGEKAFNSCKALCSIEITKAVTSIGLHAFNYCSGLDYISVDSDNPVFDSRNNCNAIIETQSNTLISGCQNTIIPDTVKSIGNGAFTGRNRLVSINIPNSVVVIGLQSFDGCSGLTSLALPDSVTEIRSYAFMYCTGLQVVTIPSSVTTIGTNAFLNCTGLSRISVMAQTPPALGLSVYVRTNDCPIYVPSSSVEAYKTAERWSDYADRIQALAPLPEAVDLGLPSGLKWASFNLGATKPEEYGDYFAWGEIEPKDYYSLEAYKWCKGSYETFTKYCDNPNYGYNGFTDGKTVLDPGDDAAYMNLGGDWRMPTDEEWTELMENCTWTWTTQNGIAGRLVTASNGNSIFLPAAGLRSDSVLGNVGSYGEYWSSSLNAGLPYYALGVTFGSDSVRRYYRYFRSYGISVRPVCK